MDFMVRLSISESLFSLECEMYNKCNKKEICDPSEQRCNRFFHSFVYKFAKKKVSVLFLQFCLINGLKTHLYIKVGISKFFNFKIVDLTLWSFRESHAARPQSVL